MTRIIVRRSETVVAVPVEAIVGDGTYFAQRQWEQWENRPDEANPLVDADEALASELLTMVDRLREIAATPRYKVTRKLLSASDRLMEAVDELQDMPKQFRGRSGNE